MNYGELVKKSLDIMWKFKYLWIFGFFAEWGSGGGAGNIPGESRDRLGGFLLDINPAIILTLILIALAVFVLFLVLYIISKGGLIHSIAKINGGESSSLGEGWRSGLKNFWRLLGIWVLLVLSGITFALLIIGPLIAFFIISLPLGILSAVVLIPLFIAGIIALILIGIYADRICVLEQKGIIDSIAEGWNTLKKNLGQSIIVGLISIASYIVFIIGFLIVGAMLAIPFVVMGFINLVVGLGLGIMVALIYIVITTGIWGAYAYSLWTLTYLDLKRLKT